MSQSKKVDCSILNKQIDDVFNVLLSHGLLDFNNSNARNAFRNPIIHHAYQTNSWQMMLTNYDEHNVMFILGLEVSDISIGAAVPELSAQITFISASPISHSEPAENISVLDEELRKAIETPETVEDKKSPSSNKDRRVIVDSDELFNQIDQITDILDEEYVFDEENLEEEKQSLKIPLMTYWTGRTSKAKFLTWSNRKNAYFKFSVDATNVSTYDDRTEIHLAISHVIIASNPKNPEEVNCEWLRHRIQQEMNIPVSG